MDSTGNRLLSRVDIYPSKSNPKLQRGHSTWSVASSFDLHDQVFRHDGVVQEFCVISSCSQLFDCCTIPFGCFSTVLLKVLDLLAPVLLCDFVLDSDRRVDQRLMGHWR